MEIQYLGLSSFLIKGKTATVATDPFDEQYVGIKYPKIDADIITVSHPHKDHNATNNVDGARIVFDSPGEYESAGISIMGFPSYHDKKKGAERGKNTIFVIECEGFRIGHFGDLGHSLTEKELGEIGDLDVAMLPVGGVYTIDAEEASELCRQISANITIPMHYQMTGLNPAVFKELADYESFVTNTGLPVENTTKLVLKQEFVEEDQKIIVFGNK